MCLHVLIFPFTSWWKGTQGCYKSLLRSQLVDTHMQSQAMFNALFLLFFEWSRCYFEHGFFFRFCSFTPSVSEITFKGCKWLQPSSWHVRRAERLIFFALKSSRIAQHFFFLVVFLDIFRVTGRIIISRECGWHTGRIFKNVKSVPDLYKRVEQTHKSVSECQHD